MIAREAVRKKLKPSLKPHRVRGRDDVWWYEDRRGIDLVHSVTGHGTVYRISWKQLLEAARRCGALKRAPEPRP